jgi:hypothetical protein
MMLMALRHTAMSQEGAGARTSRSHLGVDFAIGQLLLIAMTASRSEDCKLNDFTE